jgi:hypothetical protein
VELERHAARVASYFRAGGNGAGCLAELRPGAERILTRLEQLTGGDRAGTESLLSGGRGSQSQIPGKGIRSDALLG